ncbi:MAG TPA: outer membrane beta-barrel protein [Longimicrobiaceae bacterium]|nr:outer membrane beta-barrel protein [Longimicrobiaceae bacterium]
MRRKVFVAAALAAVAFAAPAHAQSMLPFAVEGRVGLAVPTGEFGDDLGMGYGLAANVSFNVAPTLALYGGYSYTQFDFDDEVIETDETFDVQGFEGGARLGLPMVGFSPYVKGGVVYFKGGVDGVDSDNELGFTVGGGLNYRLGPVVSFTPEVTYVTVPAEAGPNANFVRADVGLRFHL